MLQSNGFNYRSTGNETSVKLLENVVQEVGLTHNSNKTHSWRHIVNKRHFFLVPRFRRLRGRSDSGNENGAMLSRLLSRAFFKLAGNLDTSILKCAEIRDFIFPPTMEANILAL